MTTFQVPAGSLEDLGSGNTRVTLPLPTADQVTTGVAPGPTVEDTLAALAGAASPISLVTRTLTALELTTLLGSGFAGHVNLVAGVAGKVYIPVFVDFILGAGTVVWAWDSGGGTVLIGTKPGSAGSAIWVDGINWADLLGVPLSGDPADKAVGTIPALPGGIFLSTYGAGAGNNQAVGGALQVWNSAAAVNVVGDMPLTLNVLYRTVTVP